MRIENQYSYYINKWLKYFGREEALEYRDKIQKLIDDEGIDDLVSVYIVTYDDGRCCVALRAGFKGYIGSKADLHVHYSDADWKLKHILETVGLSDKIES